MSSLMAAESRPVIEPPHEQPGSLGLSDLYGNLDFYDGVSGALLDNKLATAASKTEF